MSVNGNSKVADESAPRPFFQLSVSCVDGFSTGNSQVLGWVAEMCAPMLSPHIRFPSPVTISANVTASMARRQRLHEISSLCDSVVSWTSLSIINSSLCRWRLGKTWSGLERAILCFEIKRQIVDQRQSVRRNPYNSNGADKKDVPSPTSS